jgi:hypothetical protein
MEPRDEHDDDVDNESESSADGTRLGRGMRRDAKGACVVSRGAGADGGVARGACPVENDEQRLRSFFHRCDSVLFHAPKSETISLSFLSTYIKFILKLKLYKLHRTVGNKFGRAS